MSVFAKLAARLNRVVTTAVESSADIQSFFDRYAAAYAEQHGHPHRLLEYRVGLIRSHARLRPEDVVLDIGCGNGHHLHALAPALGRGIGVDLSAQMIAVARERLRASEWRERLAFHADNAETLATIADASVDVVICVGALEHMLDKSAVLASAFRVLKRRGRFFCLTPNGSYLWYQSLAPLMRIETRHLSTDRFLTADEMDSLLREAGFLHVQMGHWRFVPKGDMPAALGFVLSGLDVVGRITRPSALRGGLRACAWKL